MLDRLFSRHLEEDEPLYLVVHKHWLLGVKQLALPLGALFATWAFLHYAPFRIVFYGTVLADIAIFVWALRNFFDYFLDAWIITDRSVIDVAWHGWFHRQSTRIDYSSIEGVSYEIQGVLGTFCKFGKVSIEKIGTGSLVSIENVKNPRDIESTILACQEACLRTKNLKDSSAIKDVLSEIIADRMLLKQSEEEKREEMEQVKMR